ncbi:MAG: type II secretion system F family protein [Caulobacteraceae bacterium]|nr:type II secretion system F family protein [Caulobacteraceae bacterium]
MSVEALLTATLSALLLIGGLALMASAARSRRDSAAKRLQLIAVSQAGAPERAEFDFHGIGAALSRGPVGGMNPAELREITRACRRLNIPARYATTVFAGLRIVPALVLATVSLFVIRLAPSHPPLAGQVLAVAAAAAVGWIAPGMILGHFTKRHVVAAAEGLPEALELLVVCVEAGLSLEDAIDRITGDLSWSQPALAEELALTSADLKILPDRDQALANLASRVDTPSVRSVVTALSQTLRYGTPLVQALRTTAAELRSDALVRMEERANQLPTLLTLPMMLLIMPTTFLIIGGPAALRLLDLFAHH